MLFGGTTKIPYVQFRPRAPYGEGAPLGALVLLSVWALLPLFFLSIEKMQTIVTE